MPRELKDDDYVLIDGAAWIEVKGFAIRLAATDNGVSMAAYRSGDEMSPAIINCCAFDSELEDSTHDKT